ncbi:MAG: hypothetical protein RL497_2851 [Pseudomonadota bacterium]|jgi:uncharacterized protein
MFDLTPIEARVMGSLIEKALTTPDQYPLSLNSLTLACNQKSNREPVMDLSEAQVQSTLDDLVKKHLVSPISAMGSRVVKYQHRFCNTQFSELQLSPAELAVVCVLLLRGWQTPGELRTRTQRLHDFNDVLDVEKALHQMMGRNQPLIAKLEREPGKRESRYAHLFCGEITDLARPVASSLSVGSAAEDEIAELKNEIASLREAYTALNERVSLLEGLL